jgi:hypothetical protein
VIVPAAVGLKVTLMVQLAPTEREVPQLFVCAKLLLATIDAMFNTAAPVFVSVTGCGELVVVTVWIPKVRAGGNRVTVGTGPPIPLNRIVCGLFAALSAMVTDPYRLPLAVGVKVTLMVQLFAGATEAPQLLVWAKSPLAATLEMFKAALPVLVSVTVCAELVAPTLVLVNVSVAGSSVTTGPRTPVPASRIVCGLFAALSVRVTDPYWVPVAVGVKVTLMEQVPPLATLAPHVLVSVKLAEGATLERVKDEPPVLYKSTVSGPLLVPTTWLGKVRLVVERLTAGAATPVPVSNTTWGLPGALSMRVRAPTLAPGAVGVNVTLTTQLVVGWSGAVVQSFV